MAVRLAAIGGGRYAHRPAGNFHHAVARVVNPVDVVTGTAAHHVGPGSAVKDVVAAQAVERVVAVQAGDHVVRQRAVECFGSCRSGDRRQAARVSQPLQSCRINHPGHRFQHPIAPQRSRASDVSRSRHIGPAGCGDLLDEGLPAAAGTDAAAVEQQVCVGCEVAANLRQRGRMRGQRAGVEHAVAQAEAARRAVAEDVNGGDRVVGAGCAACGQRGGNLLPAVRVGVDQDDFDAAAKRCDERLVVG